jgi:plasmid maintenance system killer protein
MQTPADAPRIERQENFRVIFRFEAGHAVEVDDVDYH